MVGVGSVCGGIEAVGTGFGNVSVRSRKRGRGGYAVVKRR